MSTNTYLLGFRPATATAEQMRAAKDACLAAGVAPPREVVDFFECRAFETAGERVDLPVGEGGVTSWCDGIEVDLRQLDPTIKVLRFVNSY